MIRNFTIALFAIFLLLIVSITHSPAQQGMWTWMSGDSAFLYPGHYGTKGVPDPANAPPAMYSPTRWKDLDGNFWFYGGYGPEEFLGDMWKYDPLINMWTWVKGNGQVNQPAVYGTKGIPAPANNPGCRGWSCSSWADENGDLWIFGGRGYGDDPLKATMLSDIWRYNIATNEWTWMQGNGDDPTKYGTKGVSSPTNTPGVRQEVTANWTDDDDGLWFYGGISNGSLKTDRNDMWRFDISLNEWTWMSGDTVLNIFPNAGPPNVFSTAYTPGGRMSYCSWQDKEGIFWFFGGHSDFYGPDWCDLWKYDTDINQWAFVSGSISNTDGNAGALCDTSKNFFPKGRWENRVRWIDACDNLWLFGGQRNSGSLNDLWVYSTDKNVWSYVGGPLVTNNNGKYGTKGVAAPANIPGSRTGAGSWIDNDGNFWLFAGAQTTSHATLRNDLWKYVPDPDCPAISCKKLSEAGDDDFVISHAGLNNQWIVDVNKNETADLVPAITFENGIRIYPNPSTGNFIVEFDYAQYPYPIDQVTISIYNLIGQPVFSSTEKNTTTHLKKEIDLINFESGVYFLDLSLKASEKTNAVSIKKKLILSR